ncbi:sarcosine dehydrogenase, mitochondrial-like [Condylostylus longicornis]|uniref:sarcosine dehydrogenase, mitochondrial-like n=1 Tax=Condylostylus longicornis TaxID=2530218 RepID=UPI00244DD7E6|nr:sarcosine dehydrogenase, mitochondrial-like [Condylostylus longicornis]
MNIHRLENNAFMEEKQGWERPGFFLRKRSDVSHYDWYGSYNFLRCHSSTYEKYLNGNLKYQFSDHYDIIRNEALTCRKHAVVFNMSYFGKMYLTGPDAEKAAEWLFTSSIKNKENKIIYTCALNDEGGVEADLTFCKIKSFSKNFNENQTKGNCIYIVCGGASANYTYHFLDSEIKKKNFKAFLHNVTEDIGILSIQGPKSLSILQKIVDADISDSCFPKNTWIFGNIKTRTRKLKIKILRVSFVGELGFELHIPQSYCSEIYKYLMRIGKQFGLKNAGYRALYSLSSEKGYHLWGFDLRPDDTPVEANLAFTCKREIPYRGKKVVDEQRKTGVKKKLIYLTLDEHIPLWGLEGVYRNGNPIGFLRRGEYAYTLGKSIGQLYLERRDGLKIDDEYINAGHYEIDSMGRFLEATCHLKSPLN